MVCVIQKIFPLNSFSTLRITVLYFQSLQYSLESKSLWELSGNCHPDHYVPVVVMRLPWMRSHKVKPHSQNKPFSYLASAKVVILRSKESDYPLLLHISNFTEGVITKSRNWIYWWIIWMWIDFLIFIICNMVPLLAGGTNYQKWYNLVYTFKTIHSSRKNFYDSNSVAFICLKTFLETL